MKPQERKLLIIEVWVTIDEYTKKHPSNYVIELDKVLEYSDSMPNKFLVNHSPRQWVILRNQCLKYIYKMNLSGMNSEKLNPNINIHLINLDRIK